MLRAVSLGKSRIEIRQTFEYNGKGRFLTWPASLTLHIFIYIAIINSFIYKND